MVIPFEPEKHLQAVANLHYKMISWSTIAQLGVKHIYEVYKNLTVLKNTFGYVWIDKNGNLQSFLLATTDSNEARKEIMSTFSIKDIFKMLLLSFKSPKNFLSMVDSLLFIPQFIKKSKTNAEWICWFSDTTEKNQSIGVLKIFYEMKKHFLELGIKSFIAQGDKRTDSHLFLERLKGVKRKSYLQNYMFLLKS